MIKFCSQVIIAFLLLSVPGLTHPPSGGGGAKFPPLRAEQLRVLTGMNRSIPNKNFESRMRALPRRASTAAATAVSIANSASFLPCGASTDPNKCTNGMFITFYIGPNATSVTGSFSYPWPTQLSDGFRLRYESCKAPPNNSKDMAILGVFQQDGYQQVNVYVQGDVSGPPGTPGEPFGSCNLVNDDFTATFNVLSATDQPFYAANGNQANRFESVKMDRATPALFSANGGGTTGTATGYHLTVTGVTTDLQACNSDSSQCPITTNGLSNYVVLYSTGGENIQCGLSLACGDVPERPGISFKNPGGAKTIVVPDFIGEVYLGVEQWNVPIGTLAPNQYTITIVSGVRDLSIQALTVNFGPGN